MKLILPDWPAAKHIHAVSTTRHGGESLMPYAQLNLGQHVGDQASVVESNRQRLLQQLQSMQTHSTTPIMAPVWLDQIHSTQVLRLTEKINPNTVINNQTDACYSSIANQVCAVMTADCLPVLFCSLAGDEVAAAHAGWRGLCHGILEQTVQQFTCPANQVMAWLGPAIGATKFEVGGEVKQQFMQIDPAAAQAFSLIDAKQEKYLADIYLLARQRLNRLGISQIYGGEHCTVSEPEDFFSYRRDKITGRMASLIWFE